MMITTEEEPKRGLGPVTRGAAAIKGTDELSTNNTKRLDGAGSDPVRWTIPADVRLLRSGSDSKVYSTSSGDVIGQEWSSDHSSQSGCSDPLRPKTFCEEVGTFETPDRNGKNWHHAAGGDLPFDSSLDEKRADRMGFNETTASTIHQMSGVPSTMSTSSGTPPCVTPRKMKPHFPSEVSPLDLLAYRQVCQEITLVSHQLRAETPLPGINYDSARPFSEYVLLHGVRNALRVAVQHLPELAASMDGILRAKHETRATLLEAVVPDGPTDSWLPDEPLDDPSGMNSRYGLEYSPAPSGHRATPKSVTWGSSSLQSPVFPEDEALLGDPPLLDLASLLHGRVEDDDGENTVTTRDRFGQVGLSLQGNWTCIAGGGVERPKGFELDDLDPPLSAPRYPFTSPMRSDVDLSERPEDEDEEDEYTGFLRNEEAANASNFGFPSSHDDPSIFTRPDTRFEDGTAGHRGLSGNDIPPGLKGAAPGGAVQSADQHAATFYQQRAPSWLQEVTAAPGFVPRQQEKIPHAYNPTGYDFYPAPSSVPPVALGSFHGGRFQDGGGRPQASGMYRTNGLGVVDEGSMLITNLANHHHQGPQPVGMNVGMNGTCDENQAVRRYNNDQDRMVYVSWIPKKARAFTTSDKRKQELELKRRLREGLGLAGLNKVLLFPPKGVHCKLIFDHRSSAATFLERYGGDNCSVETESWKIDLCRIYDIDMQDRFDKTVVKIEWSQK